VEEGKSEEKKGKVEDEEGKMNERRKGR